MHFGRYFSKEFISSSLGILASRIGGLFRDIFLSSTFGTSGALSSFLTIFSFVNIFRRIFGEGSTNAIIVPQVTQELNKSNEDAYRYSSTIIANISTIIIVLIIILSLSSLIMIALIPQLTFIWQIILILLPYILFICLSAILSGLLNIKKSFFFPSFSSITTNLAVIIFCLAFSQLVQSEQQKILLLSIFVTLASLLQCCILLLKLRKLQWKFSFKINFKSQTWKNFKPLFIPVFISAILLNLGTYIDRGLAWAISENTVSALYFAERLTYLPIGLFAVALATTTLPLISENFAKKELIEAEKNINKAFSQVLLLAIPTTTFLIFYKQEALSALFLRGNFDEQSLKLTLNALNFYIIGIPAFCLIKIITTAYYSQNNTQKPLHAGILGVIANLIISISFISILQEGAIALGTSMAAYISLIYLIIRLPNLSKKNISIKLSTNFLLTFIISFFIFYILKTTISLPNQPIIRTIIILLIAVIGILSTSFITRKLLFINKKVKIKQKKS